MSLDRGLLKAGPLLALGLLPGCARRDAPTLSLFGSYFPVWILCGIVGVLGAAAARMVLVAFGLSQVVPAQLLFCVAVGVIVAGAFWLGLSQ